MTCPAFAREAPWDQRALGVPCWELAELTPETEEWLAEVRGFVTLKIPSDSSKGKPETLGFRYHDTLLIPTCNPDRFKPHDDLRCAVTDDYKLDSLLGIISGAFTHDRFHKDPLVSPEAADLRYSLWLRDLHNEGRLRAFVWEEREVAGFWGYSAGGAAVLHVLTPAFRGKGLAKGFWTAGCRMLFNHGYREVSSSVSASNLSVINLYSSLGFSLRKAVDVYHLHR